MTDEGLGVECVLNFSDVPELDGRSYQHLMINQPIKLGGVGLRSLVDTCPAAYIGAAEMALPHMVGDDEEIGICPQLERVTGRGNGENRWSTFLEYNSRSARE